jgi:outer membrane protein OmpA-like peptidoglycan-associated protein
MKRSKARGLMLLGSTGLVAFAATACGGVITFQDEAAIAIMGTPPPPPPPEPEPVQPKRVELRDNKIVINEKIQFAYNDAKILEVSHSLLDEVAKVIKENPHVKKIAIEGHASSEGADEHNLKLSDRRAKSVKAYLVDQGGIPATKLTAEGFGEKRLLVSEDGLEGPELEAAREKNRRVEFNVVEQDVTQKKVEIDPDTGKEKVLETKSLAGKAQAAGPVATPPADNQAEEN